MFFAGGNMGGESGLGMTQRQQKPKKLAWTEPLGAIKTVSSGNQWHAYLTEDGELWVAGQNNSGQLGLGHYNRQTSAIKNPFYSKKKIRCVATGTYGDHMLVVLGLFVFRTTTKRFKSFFG